MRKIFVVILVMSQVGCAPVTYRTNSKFDGYFNEKKKVAVVDPDMKIFRFTAGGVDQYQDDWSIRANEFMKEELIRELDTFDTIEFVHIDKNLLNDVNKGFIDQQKAVYFMVAYSVAAHLYEPATLFKHKKVNFDYTLGSELADFKHIEDVEAILFINGRNYIWTAGRSSLALLSGAVTLFTGVYIPVPAGKEMLTASLVDVESGDILWFNYLAMPGDMRKHKTDRRLIKKLFRDFPEEWRNTVKWEKRKEDGDVESE